MEGFKRKHRSFETWFGYLIRNVNSEGRKQWKYTQNSSNEKELDFYHNDLDAGPSKKSTS